MVAIMNIACGPACGSVFWGTLAAVCIPVLLLLAAGIADSVAERKRRAERGY